MRTIYKMDNIDMFHHCRMNNIFRNILQRCNNNKNTLYKWYGGRGIKCLWKNFGEFRDDMYESYVKHVDKFGEKQTSIDRIDTNGDYCKENCRWATTTTQAMNKRSKKIVVYNDKSYSLKELCLILGKDYSSVYGKLRYGQDINYAIGTTKKIN